MIWEKALKQRDAKPIRIKKNNNNTNGGFGEGEGRAEKGEGSWRSWGWSHRVQCVSLRTAAIRPSPVARGCSKTRLFCVSLTAGLVVKGNCLRWGLCLGNQVVFLGNQGKSQLQNGELECRIEQPGETENFTMEGRNQRESLWRFKEPGFPLTLGWGECRPILCNSPRTRWPQLIMWVTMYVPTLQSFIHLSPFNLPVYVWIPPRF